MTGNVMPFRRPGPPEPLPPAEAALSRRVQRAQPGARALAAEQASARREHYASAAIRQKNERLIASGKIVPARVTIALDLCGLDGPEVDLACGAAEPDVDMWELGLAVPSAGQVERLAGLTGFPAAYFYRPVAPGPLAGEPVFMCGRRCETIEPDVVDDRGVLHRAGDRRHGSRLPSLSAAPIWESPGRLPPPARAPAARLHVDPDAARRDVALPRAGEAGDVRAGRLAEGTPGRGRVGQGAASPREHLAHAHGYVRRHELGLVVGAACQPASLRAVRVSPDEPVQDAILRDQRHALEGHRVLEGAEQLVGVLRCHASRPSR